MTKNRIALITGGDSKYYPLISELIASVRRFPQSSTVDIHVLDAGLTEEQRAELRAQNIGTFAPDWPNADIARRGKGKEYVKACILRPFLRDLVPGYDIYIWLDGDTWIQDWSAIELFIRGAETRAMTCTMQVHHAYPKSMRLSWLGPFPFKPRSFYYSNARRAFGGAIARKLFAHNVFLAGAFALHHDAPHWDRWQTLILQALKRGKLFTAEQLTMGIMLHLDKYPVEILPLWCNWLCGFGVKFDPATGQFTEPYLPHQPLGILHLCGFDNMRVDDSVTVDVPWLDGSVHKMSLRYGEVKKLSVIPAKAGIS